MGMRGHEHARMVHLIRHGICMRCALHFPLTSIWLFQDTVPNRRVAG